MIKRTSKKFIDNTLSKNPNWKILDIGCGYNANPYANYICDVQDLSDFYKDKKFIILKDKKLPFLDKEFDFVISSHVMEHVSELKFFISELERVSKKGYIELPTKLEDNLVFENKKEHLWHMDFDDAENKLVITNRVQYLEPVLTVASIKKFNKVFRKSLLIELEWENNINHEFVVTDEDKFNKTSLLVLFRKYLSKKIRMFFK